jgi:hypothetical protein
VTDAGVVPVMAAVVQFTVTVAGSVVVIAAAGTPAARPDSETLATTAGTTERMSLRMQT